MLTTKNKTQLVVSWSWSFCPITNHKGSNLLELIKIVGIYDAYTQAKSTVPQCLLRDRLGKLTKPLYNCMLYGIDTVH